MNAVWRESKAEGRARLVLLAIADHQGEIGAWPSIATLAKMVNSSERSVQRDIQYLQQIGELRVEIQNAPTRQQYKSNLYWVLLPGVTNKVPGVTESDSGVTDLTSGVTPVGVLTLIEPLQEPLKNINGLFDDFWKVYPRKANKGGARRAFVKALAKVSFETILDGAERYASDPNRVEAFTKHPATWLNNECWDDPLLPERVLTAEERAERARREAEAKREAQLAQNRLEMALAEELRASASPAPRCVHDRLLVACVPCLRQID